MSNIYNDGSYLAANPSWHLSDSAWKAEEVNKILKKNNIYPNTFVEIGCGSGGIIVHLSTIYSEAIFHGFDISPQAFEISKKFITNKVSFTLGDYFQAEKQNYDLAICADVFEHVDDYLGFLRSISAVQKLTVFHIPLDLSLASSLFPSILTRTRELVGHLHYFNKSTAEMTLRDCGFKIIDSQITAGCLKFPEPGFKGQIFWILRKLIFKLSPKLAAQTLGGFSLMVLASSEVSLNN